MNRHINVYVGNDCGDFVRCNNCNTIMLVPRGADKCPECGVVGCMSWEDDRNPEQRWEELEKAGYHAQYFLTLKPEKYLSDEVLEDLAIQRGEKADTTVKNTQKPRYCRETRHYVLMNYEGNGTWLCMHNDIGTREEDKAADEAEVKQWKNKKR